MSDILQRLAVLAAMDENGLFPCPFCDTKAKFTLNLQNPGLGKVRCKKCGALLPHHAGHGRDKWNARPREQALIDLVQEAAAEVERVQNLIPIAYRRGWDKAAYGGLCRDAWVNEIDLRQAVEPQEAANAKGHA